MIVLSKYINSHCSLIHICTPSSCVQVVSSTRCGMGKSLYVCRIKESIRGSDVVCVPMHGPAVTSDTIMNRLLEHTSTSQSCTIFHLDIDPSVSHKKVTMSMHADGTQHKLSHTCMRLCVLVYYGMQLLYRVINNNHIAAIYILCGIIDSYGILKPSLTLLVTYSFATSHQVLHQVDSLLFSLLVLKGLTDSHGHIWRCLSHDIYVVEVTFPVHEVCSGSFNNLHVE